MSTRRGIIKGHRKALYSRSYAKQRLKAKKPKKAEMSQHMVVKPNLCQPNTKLRQPKTPRIKLVSVLPHTFVYNLTDPHWNYLVVSQTGKEFKKSIWRYSDFEVFIHELGVKVSLPDRHLLPGIGKLFDSYSDTEERGKRIQEVLLPLFRTNKIPQKRLQRALAIVNDKNTYTYDINST